MIYVQIGDLHSEQFVIENVWGLDRNTSIYDYAIYENQLFASKSCCRNTESSSSSAPNQTCFAAIDVTPVCGVTLFPSGKQRKRVNAVELSSEFTIIFQLYTLTGYANDSERWKGKNNEWNSKWNKGNNTWYSTISTSFLSKILSQ